MPPHFPPEISVGTEDDVAALAEVANAAFKGDGANEWNSCFAIIKDNPRTSEELIQRQMNKANSVFLKYTCDDGVVGGCLYLDAIGEDKFEIWLMSVAPTKQNQGIGKKLLSASVDYAREKGYKSIRLTTPTDRPDVLSWYERCGFTNTGKEINIDWALYMPGPLDPLFIYETEFIKEL